MYNCIISIGGFMCKSDLIVKDNILVNASYNLSLSEQRLILLAISESRKTGKGITASDFLEINASDYIKTFDVERQSAYEALKSASLNLFERRFSYAKENGKGTVLSRWVSVIHYEESLAKLSLVFAPTVIPFIHELEKRFTSYQIREISSLTSVYAIRLYEMLVSWKSIRKTPVFDLSDFRYKLGVESDQYTTMSNFKRKVLDIAVSQINEHTNIIVQYQQHKQGRKITGFSFTFVEVSTPVRDPNTVDCVDEDKKPTRKKITKQQAAAMGRPGEEWPELLARIGKDYHVLGI